MDELSSLRASLSANEQGALHDGSHRIPSPTLQGGFSYYPHF